MKKSTYSSKTMRFEVTEKHNCCGLACDPDKCIFKLALADAYPELTWRVWRTHTRGYAKNGKVFLWANDPRMTKSIKKFDPSKSPEAQRIEAELGWYELRPVRVSQRPKAMRERVAKRRAAGEFDKKGDSSKAKLKIPHSDTGRHAVAAKRDRDTEKKFQ